MTNPKIIQALLYRTEGTQSIYEIHNLKVDPVQIEQAFDLLLQIKDTFEEIDPRSKNKNILLALLTVLDDIMQACSRAGCQYAKCKNCEEDFVWDRNHNKALLCESCRAALELPPLAR